MNRYKNDKADETRMIRFIDPNYRELFQIPDGAYPTAHRDRLSGQRLTVSKDFRDFRIAHNLIRPLHVRYNCSIFYSIFLPFTRGKQYFSGKIPEFCRRQANYT